MEAERSPDGAEEVLGGPAAVREPAVDPEPEPVSGRRFNRARAQ